MTKEDVQKGNVALIMVVVLMTMGLLLLKALHYYQERARDELYNETKYLEAFNHAESALSWGLLQSWKLSRSRNTYWECKKETTQGWSSCLRHVKGNNFVLLGKSDFKQGDQIKVYRWVTSIAGSQKIKMREKGWLDYCIVEKKGFCL